LEFFFNILAFLYCNEVNPKNLLRNDSFLITSRLIEMFDQVFQNFGGKTLAGNQKIAV
jgi:hypothetical protein